MGYVCPVCEDPQADGEHLANHLAFTAVLGDDAHESWLDDHAPGWGDSDPESLAERVVDHAAEAEFPRVFEDTTDRDHGRTAGHGHEHGDASDPDGGERARSGDALDAPEIADTSGDRSVPADVLAEARELTRERRGGEHGPGDDADEPTGGDGEDDAGDGTVDDGPAGADGADETGDS